MLLMTSAAAAILLLLLGLRLSQRLTLRLKVLAGVTVSRQPQKSCPHLGHAADPFNHAAQPSDEHRCYLYMQRDRVDLMHQKSFCLSTAHHKCPWLMIRRPDAPPPLGQRLRNALQGGPRQAWGLAFASVRRLPSLGARVAGGLRKDVALLERGLASVARIVDVAVSRLAAAIRAVSVDVARAVDFAVGRVARALRAVAADAWALTQRSNVAVAWLARTLRLVFRGVSWLVRAGARLSVSAVALIRHAVAARRRQAAVAEAAPAVPAEAAPAAAPQRVEEPLPYLVPEVFQQAAAEAELSLAGSLPAEADQAVSQRLEAPLARFEELVARLESLLSDGITALDKGQEGLAYQLFLKATEQPKSFVEKATPQLQTQHASLMTRAWFWRAKTAETVEEVVDTLEQALRYEPENLQIQAHLAWARQRLDRDRHVQQGTVAALQAGSMSQLTPRREGGRWRRSLGTAVRVVGGLMALALAALWMTTAVMPAVGRYLGQLPAADELLLRRLVLTLDATALPGHGHLPLPMVNYDLGLAVPFVMAFLFVFTARGLMDGDSWARSTGLLLAGVGGWLCAAVVANPDASRIGLALCVGIIIAAALGRFDSPKVMPQGTGRY